jgi:hypothetical protein
MEEGFMLDKGESNRPSVDEWVEGIPEPSFWLGVKLKGRQRLKAVTYRCTRCGLLQAYAFPQ